MRKSKNAKNANAESYIDIMEKKSHGDPMA